MSILPTQGKTPPAAQKVWNKYRSDRPDVEETQEGFRFKEPNYENY
jgi:hypothetical protein